MTDALGNLVHFELLPGRRNDSIGVDSLWSGLEFGGLSADKAFNSNKIVAELNQRKAQIVIAQMSGRVKPLDTVVNLR